MLRNNIIVQYILGFLFSIGITICAIIVGLFITFLVNGLDHVLILLDGYLLGLYN